MLYMVVEEFIEGPKPIYQRLAEKGRMMPDSLHYVSSYITEDLKTCYQIMETEQFEDFAEWQKNWSDIMRCQIFPVLTSAEARLAAEKL